MKHPAHLPADAPITTGPALNACNTDSDDPPPDEIERLVRTLSAVRRQCKDWATWPTSARTWESRVRDRSISVAASLLIDLIDHMAPGISDDDQEQRDQTPTLYDRISTVLLTTPRGDVRETPGLPHGEGGHTYDDRCALCTDDTDTLTAALVHAVTLNLLPVKGVGR
ncbi:hypothetical protein [Streptomyces sp. NPDC059063]|uniref:hypothetical protein n=1 Tax=Streptomyces sp. NPDC059063 TaxID=3346712 RepID=UPI0036ACD394